MLRFNVNGAAGADLPTFQQVVDQIDALDKTGLFSADQIATYAGAALGGLQSGDEKQIGDALQALLKARNNDQPLPEALQKIVDQVSDANGIVPSGAAWNSLIDTFRDVLAVSNEVTRYVFIGLGGAIAVMGLASGFTVARGYAIKRKYGVAFSQYVKTRAILSAVALAAAALGAVLIVIAVSGVV